LKQHINRTAFVARMWALADTPMINQKPQSTDDGWELVDGGYDVVMFSGLQVPEALTEGDDDNVIINEDSGDDDLINPSDSDDSDSEDSDSE